MSLKSLFLSISGAASLAYVHAYDSNKQSMSQVRRCIILLHRTVANNCVQRCIQLGAYWATDVA